MTRSVLNAIGARAEADPVFCQELQQAWCRGGPAAAAQVVQAHGLDVSGFAPADGQLSDLELEQVAGGKGPVWIGPAPWGGWWWW